MSPEFTVINYSTVFGDIHHYKSTIIKIKLYKNTQIKEINKNVKEHLFNLINSPFLNDIDRKKYWNSINKSKIVII